ncbi:MAG: hypothetical protein ACE5GG_03580, partial [Candidatus Omnitrophota bacterium]
EEECRLLYVAVTRAGQRLDLSMSAGSGRAGRRGRADSWSSFSGDRLCRFLRSRQVRKNLQMIYGDD